MSSPYEMVFVCWLFFALCVFCYSFHQTEVARTDSSSYASSFSKMLLLKCNPLLLIFVQSINLITFSKSQFFVYTPGNLIKATVN